MRRPIQMKVVLAATLGLLLFLSWAQSGCGTEEPVEPTAIGPEAAKADCPDCDPAGPNAFVQAGVGSGFYQAGQSWQVAFRYNHSPRAEMRGDVFFERDTTTSEVYLFDYVVTATDKMVVDSVLRQTATVEVTQASPAGAEADLFGPERIDGNQQKVTFTMNDLLEPVSETITSRRYPNGKRVELDSKSSLRMGASIFPRTIPRLLVSGSTEGPAPEVPADLQDVLDALNPTWSVGTYRRYTFDNGDVVYWARDREQYWPFYVQNRQGEGVLVRWNGQS